MRSTVTKLCDWRRLSVPKELGKWHMDEKAVDEKLAELANSHAAEIQADVVRKGDSVRLRCTEGSLTERTVLLYPGLGLPQAAEAEQAVTGCRVGAQIHTQIGGKEQCLVVEEIRRRTPAAVDDALIRAEQIEGVATLEAYAHWYQERTEEQNKENARKNIAYYLQQEIVRLSEYALDQDEVYEWTDKRARQEFDELLSMGEDPRIPEDGVELLSDEQAIETLRESALSQFKTILACEALCAQEGISIAWEDVRGEFEEMLPPEVNIPEEEREKARAGFLENVAIMKTFLLLQQEANAYLED